jgi:mRNA interferase MazF
MSTAELIYEKAKALPGTLQTEALHYVDFLLSRQEAKTEDGDWARFSASQLEKQYAPADAVYDTDGEEPVSHSQGEILLVSLVFSSQAGTKRRPVVVVYDSVDADLLVAPITSHVARTSFDVTVTEWQRAGLRLPSVVRVDKLATIEKTTIVRQLGTMTPSDWASITIALRGFFEKILPQ